MSATFPKGCGHRRLWSEPCAECDAVWREERITKLHEQAARYGFRMVPLAVRAALEQEGKGDE